MSPFSSLSVFQDRSVFARVVMAGVLILAIVTPSWGQEPSTKPDRKGAQVHWRTYISREYGFSFRYADTYKRTGANAICKDNDYRRYLLCLERQDDAEASSLVTVIIAEPFQVHPGHGDVMPTRRRIGHHVFYCGLGGSMGTGFADRCTFDLRGKTLEFNFSPAETVNSSDTTNALVFKSLKTFRML